MCSFSQFFDAAVNIVSKLGKNSMMAKIDIKTPGDWHQLGFTFLSLHYIDFQLTFGMRSSVNRFNTLATKIDWIMQNNYGLVNSTHYLDDYFMASPNSDSCRDDLETTLSLFSKLGIPLAQGKIEGLSTIIKYLGITINI